MLSVAVCGVASGALREHQVARQSRLNCVVEVIAHFFVVLEAFFAPTEVDRGGVTLDRMCNNGLITGAKRQRTKAKLSELIAQVHLDTFAVSRTCRCRRACR